MTSSDAMNNSYWLQVSQLFSSAPHVYYCPIKHQHSPYIYVPSQVTITITERFTAKLKLFVLANTLVTTIA